MCPWEENTTTNCDRAPPRAKEDSFTCLRWRLSLVMENSGAWFSFSSQMDGTATSLKCFYPLSALQTPALVTAVSAYNTINQKKTNR